MKKSILTTLIAFASLAAFSQAKTDSVKHYKFEEPETILIDNLMGQLDVLAGNSDKISTAQYNSIHRAVIHIDSLIKVQYFKFHPQPKQPAKNEKPKN
jgi:hypothetical protein